MSSVTTERERFEALFREHYAALTRYAIRRVGPDSATEVVAETFLTVWRRLEHLPDGNPRPWLYGIARRVVANEQRRWGRNRRLNERIRGTATPAAPDHADGVADRLRVRAALDRLSARDREVLLLAEWEQLSAQDAAEALGCSVAAYHVRLHRARRRIATHLHVEEPTPDPPLALVPADPKGSTP
jgi:RNA polymerase sigma-70 factor (ECF subfamily)